MANLHTCNASRWDLKHDTELQETSEVGKLFHNRTAHYCSFLTGQISRTINRKELRNLVAAAGIEHGTSAPKPRTKTTRPPSVSRATRCSLVHFTHLFASSHPSLDASLSDHSNRPKFSPDSGNTCSIKGTGLQQLTGCYRNRGGAQSG